MSVMVGNKENDTFVNCFKHIQPTVDNIGNIEQKL